MGSAFKQIGENVLAGPFLAFSHPFRAGDLIRLGDLPEGIVRSLDLRQTHIRTFDGRDVFIPNSRLFTDPLVNLTHDGLRRPAFTLALGYAVDTARARTLMVDAVAGVPGVLAEPRPFANVIAFELTTVTVEVAFWIDVVAGTDYALVQSAAMEACRNTLHTHGIQTGADVAAAMFSAVRQNAPSPGAQGRSAQGAGLG